MSDAVSYTHLDVYKRQCPMCTKRRSRKIYAQSYKVMQVASQKYEFIFLTLTQKNVSADELKDELDKICLLYTSRCV